MPELSDVFGLDSYKNPASYVVRKLEEEFVKALGDSAVSAIVIYGMSKQGKTSLLRHAGVDRKLKKSFIKTDGNRGLELEDLFHDLLSKAGFVYEETEVDGRITARWFWVQGGVGGRQRRQPIPLKIRNPASVAEELAKYKDRPVIVVDQFHTLEEKVQAQFATAIASFAEKGCKVVVIGTWIDAGYLIRYNSNLIAKVREFSFDDWNPADLRAVLDKGLPLLGLDGVPDNVRRSLVDRSANNVALLQELTKLCLSEFKSNNPNLDVAKDLSPQHVAAAANALRERVLDNVLQALKPITLIGDSNHFALRKSRSWWVLNAFLEGTYDEKIHGMEIELLLKRTNELATEAATKAGEKPNKIDKPELVLLLKRHWYADQTTRGVTPILAYNEKKEALVVVDAWTRFVLRTYDTRQKLRAEL